MLTQEESLDLFTAQICEYQQELGFAPASKSEPIIEIDGYTFNPGSAQRDAGVPEDETVISILACDGAVSLEVSQDDIGSLITPDEWAYLYKVAEVV